MRQTIRETVEEHRGDGDGVQVLPPKGPLRNWLYMMCKDSVRMASDRACAFFGGPQGAAEAAAAVWTPAMDTCQLCGINNPRH